MLVRLKRTLWHQEMPKQLPKFFEVAVVSKIQCLAKQEKTANSSLTIPYYKKRTSKTKLPMLQVAQTKCMLVIRPIKGAKQAGGKKKVRANEYSDFPCAGSPLLLHRAVPAAS